MSRHLPWLVACAALAAALFTRPASPTPAAPVSEGSLKKLQREVSALASELGDLQAQQDTLDLDLSTLEAEVAPPSVPPPVDRAAADAARLAGYARRLELEGADLAWAAEAEAALTRNLQPEDRGVRVVSASCGATLCRVEAELADPEAVTWMLDEAPAAVGWDNAAFVRIEGFGPGYAVLYVTREGHPLDA